MLRLPAESRSTTPSRGNLSPACLPITRSTRNETFLGVRCIATGWGQTVFGGDLEDELHQVEMTVVENDHCSEVYGMKYQIPILDYHLCAGPVLAGGRGTCVVRAL